ncbi:MAG: hypothetical protein mread185_000706 [Mycoplasmataceae bacterium]|nr:MAG: hypothetical protein mread185_000568 [Mycoplasmataceae bacterium]WNE41249.1 MAG: hypothetical protein mread185_000706 [Mycoplasmataceae bacterium]
MNKDFEKYLSELEDPKNDQEENYDLPENPTALELAKYNICQNILRYKRENNLSREQVAQQIQLSKAETEELLFCHINNFTLDRLTEYASRIFSNLEIKITRAENRQINI